MLVRQLVGPLAGRDVELSFDAVVSGYRQDTVHLDETQRAMVERHIARGVIRPEEVEAIESVRSVAPPTPIVATPVAVPPVRRGGWPKGKPRGPRKPAGVMI